MHFRRTATEDVVLRGRTIRSGDRVVMWYPSANHDEEVFDSPFTFDIRRQPNDHLTFGTGRHVCLGASLARLEVRVVFEELLRRVASIEITGPPDRLRSNFINGIKHLPVEGDDGLTPLDVGQQEPDGEGDGGPGEEAKWLLPAFAEAVLDPRTAPRRTR